MNRKIILVATIIGIVLITFLCFNDYLPPRTPIKIARISSGLKISKSTKVVDFKEDYTFTGEGQIEVRLKFADSDIEDIKKGCLKSDYKKLTIENLINDGFLNSDPHFGFNMPNADLRSIKNGYYKLKASNLEKLDFTMIVFDIDKNELCIWSLIP